MLNLFQHLERLSRKQIQADKRTKKRCTTFKQKALINQDKGSIFLLTLALQNSKLRTAN